MSKDLHMIVHSNIIYSNQKETAQMYIYWWMNNQGFKNAARQ